MKVRGINFFSSKLLALNSVLGWGCRLCRLGILPQGELPLAMEKLDPSTDVLRGWTVEKVRKLDARRFGKRETHVNDVDEQLAVRGPSPSEL